MPIAGRAVSGRVAGRGATRSTRPRDLPHAAALRLPPRSYRHRTAAMRRRRPGREQMLSTTKRRDKSAKPCCCGSFRITSIPITSHHFDWHHFDAHLEGAKAHLLMQMQRFMQLFPRSVQLPASETHLYRAPRRKLARQVTPVTPGNATASRFATHTKSHCAPGVLCAVDDQSSFRQKA